MVRNGLGSKRYNSGYNGYFTWDNYFWWTEFSKFPTEAITLPLEWPPSSARAMEIEASIGPNNRIRVKSSAANISIFLNPDLVDLDGNESFLLNQVSKSCWKTCVPEEIGNAHSGSALTFQGSRKS